MAEVSTVQKAKKTKKQRKHDRNRKRGGQNARYIAEHRHAKSHYKRILEHLKRYAAHGADKVANEAVIRYKALAGYR